MKTATFEQITGMRDETMIALMEAKESGRKVVGYYCTYSPIELAMAAGAIAVPLCARRKGPLVAADNDLPQNLCPVVRTMYDVAATDTCPFFHASDMVVAETTCDGKKKVYEMLQRIKLIHVMNLPQIPDLPESLRLWESEMRRLKTVIEEKLDVRITDEALRRAIHVTNEEARARKAFFDLNRAKPALISGKDLVVIASASEFGIDRAGGIALLDRLTTEIEELARKGHRVGSETTPRVLLTGCPVGSDDIKVVGLVEECGGEVVAMENCGGYKTVESRIDETDRRDPLLLLAEKYLAVPCSVMSPNSKRMDLLESMARDFHIDGVIDLTWQACHTYNVESYWVADLVQNKLGLPFLHLETNFSDSDSENLRVRIEAFMEML
jgi:benzoyl-CoA reductase/2-hydroxyglutaryl-CoA dehydratase subunit BcrC/BadD/HgdB